jgi:fimbrial chaperone protein
VKTRALLVLLAAASTLPTIAHAQSGGSLILWPLNPTIKANENATALWLENPSEKPITLQVQSYAWNQQNGEDVYAPQKEVIATPPVVTLAPKAKQLIRITRLGPPPSIAERPFRLIVDEIPVERVIDAGNQMVTGVQFRMRYSLPLFTYAAGLLPTSEAATAPQGKGVYPAPNLVWHLRQDGKQRIIEIENRGNGHARLTQAKLLNAGTEVELASGLMGYVLAGSRLRYPLPQGSEKLASAAQFIASINAAAPSPVPIMPPAPQP